MSIIQKWNGKKIHIRDDRYVNATDMAKATGKVLKRFYDSEETQRYLLILSKRCNVPVSKDLALSEKKDNTIYRKTDIPQSFLIEVAQKGKTRNTYFHPKLALRFAQWCSAEFAVEVDFWLDDLLQGKKSKSLPHGINQNHYHLYRPLEDGKAKWEKRFFSDFYDALYALDDRENNPPYHQHPTYFSKLTIKYVYDEFEAVAPSHIIKELKIIKQAHEDEGVKGIKTLHQLLSPEGQKILEKTLITITTYLNVANTEGQTPEQRRVALEYWLQVKRGQKTLPVVQASLQKIAQLKPVSHVGEYS